MAYIAVFFAMEAMPIPETYWVTDTVLDEYIPFVPQFVFGYILWYPLFAVVGLPTLIKDGAAFRRYMYFLMLGFTATLVFCLLVPNGQHQRPQGVEINSISTWLLSLIWAADTHTNVFPSMHVIGAVAAVLAAFDSEALRKIRPLVCVMALLITLSTVFVKQHAVIDIFGAYLFCIPPFLLFYKRRFFGKSRA